MNVKTTKAIDLLALGAELGMRQRDLEFLKKAEITDCEFEFNTPFDKDGCLDGHVMIDHFEFVRQLNIISRALEFPFCMASYKILTRGVLDELEKHASSIEAIEDAVVAYHNDIAQLEEDSLRERTESS